MSTPTIDWSKYATASTPQIDFSKYEAGATGAPPLDAIAHKIFSGQALTPDEQSFATTQLKQGEAETATRYGKGLGMMAGGGLKTVGVEAPSLLHTLYNNPSVRGIIDDALTPVTKAISKAATFAGDSLNPDLVGIVSPRAANFLRTIQKVGKVAQAYTPRAEGLTEVEAARPEAEAQLSSRIATERQLRAQPSFPNAAQGLEEVEAGQPQARELLQRAVQPRESTALPEAKPQLPTSEPLPPSERSLSGESALRKVLTGQDNANLLKIAKARGVNVTKESQLRPGVADNQLIEKIIDDFKPEELDELRSRYLESTRFRHDFGDIGPEAWKTLSLQTYFPDLKLSQALVNRTHAAILKSAASKLENMPAPEEDLTDILKESVKQAKQKKSAQ